MTTNHENQENEQEKHPSLAIVNKSPVSFAYKDLLKRPPHVLATEEELAGYKEMFDPFFEVENYFGKSLLHGFKDGVHLGAITPKGKGGSLRKPVMFFIHKAEEDPKSINEIRAKLAPIAKTTHHEVIDSIVAYAVEMRKRDSYKEIEEEETNLLLSDTIGASEAAKWFHALESEMVSDPEFFASLSQQNYDKKLHHGILLDTSRMKRKYGEFAVGVHRKFLLSLFCGIDVDDEDATELKASNPMLNDIIDGWKKAGFLSKKTELGRSNEKITGLNANNDCDRFYVVKSEKLYTAWTEYMKEVELENGND